ncbi:MAG: hypothetical protein ACPG7F_08450 [Aggregatilineales bacterium]
MRYIKFLIFAVILFVLAACQPGNDSSDSQNNTTSQGIVQWNSDPLHVVFQINTAGGRDEDSFWRLNEVPTCTIYGDGRLVQLQELSDSTVTDVVFTRLTDSQMATFIESLAVTYQIFSYDAGIESQLPEINSPVYEQIIVHVNDVRHVTDVFAEWPALLYDDILRDCQSLGGARAIFEPEGAWISVQETEYNQGVPSLFWEPEATGLSLNDISSNLEKIWVEGRNVKVLWNELRDNGLDLQFHEDGIYYHMALQIPGVTIDAPPAPQS